jgi:hypothetical protein
MHGQQNIKPDLHVALTGKTIGGNLKTYEKQSSFGNRGAFRRKILWFSLQGVEFVSYLLCAHFSYMNVARSHAMLNATLQRRLCCSQVLTFVRINLD